MTEHGARERSRPRLRLTIVTATLILLFVVAISVYVTTAGNHATLAPESQSAATAAVNMPDLRFYDQAGKPLTLADFRGKVMLLNIWATWCTPCRKEMPALERLQQKLGGPDFEVVALSIDRGGAADVRRFYDEIGISALAIYVDPESQATAKLKTLGVPTTLLIDRAGRELWRKTGIAEWDAPDVVEELRSRLKELRSPSLEGTAERLP